MTAIAARATVAAWWSALELAARYGVQFVVTLVLARLLVPADFGLVSIVLIFTSIGALLVDSGFGTALIQRQHTSADDETTIFIFAFCVGLLMALALILLAPAFSAYFSQPTLTPLLRVAALVLPFGALAAVPDALLTMRMDFRVRANAEIVASSCSGLFAIVLAWRGFGVWSLVWQNVVAMAVRAGMLWWCSGWRPRGRYRVASFRSLFGYGGFILLTGMLNAVSTRIQAFLIGKLFNARDLGLYTLAQNTQQTPANLFGAILNRVGLPLFSGIASDREKLRSVFCGTLRMAMFLFTPCMIGLALVSKPLIELLFGHRWIEAAPIFSVLAVGTVLWPLHVLNLAVIGALGRSALLLKVELLKQSISILLIVLCAPWGTLAIAWAVVGGSFIAAVFNAHYTKALLGYGLLQQLADQRGTCLLSIVAGLVGWLVLRFQEGVMGLFAAIVAAALAYLGCAVVLRLAALSDIASLLRDFVSKRGRQ